jgi:hypothetical protein
MAVSTRAPSHPVASTSRARAHNDRSLPPTGERFYPTCSTAPQNFSFHRPPPVGPARFVPGTPSHPQLNPVHLYSANGNPSELYYAHQLTPHTTPSRADARTFSTPSRPPLEALSARLAAAEGDDAEDLDFEEDEDIEAESSDDDQQAQIGLGEVRTFCIEPTRC